MDRQEFESMTICPLDGRYSGIKDALAEYFSEFLRPLASGYFSALFPGKRENSFFTGFFTDAFLVSITRWLRSPEPMPAQEYVARLKEVVTGIARKVAQEES